LEAAFWLTQHSDGDALNKPTSPCDGMNYQSMYLKALPYWPAAIRSFAPLSSRQRVLAFGARQTRTITSKAIAMPLKKAS